jgi:toxin-antitoxin system PIN domain toxin
MSATVDANVLIYASDSQAESHDPAEALVRRLAAGPEILYLFWPVLLGYLRIVTHPGILTNPLSPVAALGNVEAMLDRPHVRAPGELDGFWPMFRSTAGERPRGNDVPDAHVAALMRQHGVRVIYTRYRDYRRFDGIDVRDPFR